jgi:hypothetical protein
MAGRRIRFHHEFGNAYPSRRPLTGTAKSFRGREASDGPVRDLRHSCASLLLSLRVHAKLVQETLGQFKLSGHHGHLCAHDSGVAE